MRTFKQITLLLLTVWGTTSLSWAELPLVLVSIAPQKFIVDSIAPELVRVETLIPVGSNHETFEPGMNQLSLLKSAKIYFTIGHPDLLFEQRWTEYFGRDLKVVPSGIAERELEHDPHVWNSPVVMRGMVELMARELGLLLPLQRDKILTDANLLKEKILRVEEEAREIVTQSQRKEFLVFHPAWGYFAMHYGLIQLAIEEHGKEPGPGRVAQIIDRAKASGIRRIFIQPQFPRGAAEIIAQEIGARVLELDPSAYNWLDNHLATAKAIAGVEQ